MTATKQLTKRGKAKNPNKGFGSMEQERLRELSRAAALKRWSDKREQAKMAGNVEGLL